MRDSKAVAIHVMAAMRHLEKIDGEYVSYLDEKPGVFSTFLERIQATGDKSKRQNVRELLSAMSNYDLLSEVAHPNGLGTQFLYPMQTMRMTPTTATS